MVSEIGELGGKDTIHNHCKVTRNTVDEEDTMQFYEGHMSVSSWQLDWLKILSLLYKSCALSDISGFWILKT